MKKKLRVTTLIILGVIVASPLIIGAYARYAITSLFLPRCVNCAEIKNYHTGWRHSQITIDLGNSLPWQSLTLTLEHGPWLAPHQWGLMAIAFFLDNQPIGHMQVDLHGQINSLLHIPGAQHTMSTNQHYQFSAFTLQVSPIKAHEIALAWQLPDFSWRDKQRSLQVQGAQLLCQGKLTTTDSGSNHGSCLLEHLRVQHHNTLFNADQLSWEMTQATQGPTAWWALQMRVASTVTFMPHPQQQLLANITLNHVAPNDLFAVAQDLVKPLPRSRGEWLLSPIAQHVFMLISNQMALHFNTTLTQQNQKATLTVQVHPSTPLLSSSPSLSSSAANKASPTPTLIDVNFQGAIALTNSLLNTFELLPWQRHLQVLRGNYYQWHQQVQL